MPVPETFTLSLDDAVTYLRAVITVRGWEIAKLQRTIYNQRKEIKKLKEMRGIIQEGINHIDTLERRIRILTDQNQKLLSSTRISVENID